MQDDKLACYQAKCIEHHPPLPPHPLALAYCRQVYKLVERAYTQGEQSDAHNAQGSHTHELEGGNRVSRAAAVGLIRCGICRWDGSCALGIQVEDMHSALITGHC